MTQIDSSNKNRLDAMDNCAFSEALRLDLEQLPSGASECLFEEEDSDPIREEPWPCASWRHRSSMMSKKLMFCKMS